MTSSEDDPTVCELWTSICLGKHHRLKATLDSLDEAEAEALVNRPHGAGRDWPLLRLAAYLDDVASARLLLSAGADPNAFSGHSWSTGSVYGVNYCRSRTEVSFLG